MTQFRKRKTGTSKQKGKVFPVGGNFTPKKFHAERSLASQRQDNRLKAPLTNDAEKWARNPGHLDLQGVDTPVKVVRKKLGIRKHLLLTEEMKKTIPKLYSQENVKDPMVYAKFFDPTSNWTWYVTEFDGEDMFFGLVDGHEKEMGYFSLSELENVRGRFGLPIERDMCFKATTLSSIHNSGKKESSVQISDAEKIKLRKTFDRNEDKNHHTENALILINRFGTKQEKALAKEKYKKFRNSQNGISHQDSQWFYENSSKHYPKIGFQ